VVAQNDQYGTDLDIDSLSDGLITATLNLPPGDYSVWVNACPGDFDPEESGPACDSNELDFVVEAPPPPQLSCNSPVTRGQIVTCTVSGVSASGVSSWSFTGGGATVSGPTRTATWSGTMVVSGTVTVNLSGSPALHQDITVNARSWHTQPASPVQVANGALTKADGSTITLAVPPSADSDSLGIFYFHLAYGNSPSPPTVSGGPNAGFIFYTTPLPITDSRFQYIINPDLENQNSVFSQHQCGGATGFISWSNLYAQTKRHEYDSATQSHWAFYSTSQNKNNLGDYYEGRFATSGTSLANFNSATSTGLQDLLNQVLRDTAVEPYAVNQSSTGSFLGNINFGPDYAPCQ